MFAQEGATVATKEEEDRFDILVDEWKKRMGDLLRLNEETRPAIAVIDAAGREAERLTRESLSDLFLPGWREDFVAAVASKYGLWWDRGLNALCLVRKDPLPTLRWVENSASKAERYAADNRANLLASFMSWLKEEVGKLPYTQEVWVHLIQIKDMRSSSPSLEDQAVYRIRIPAGIMPLVDEEVVYSREEAVAVLNVLRRVELHLPDISDPEIREGGFRIM